MASELLPCPFCGSERAATIPANKKSTERLFPIVRCMGCFTDVPGKTNDFSLECTTAIERWNTRPTPVAPVSPDAAGKCGELETVGNISEECLSELKQMLCGEIHPCNDIGDVTDADIELVTRSQAAELLAAERHERDMLKADFNDINAERQRWRDRAEKAEADNAAKVEQERLRFEGDLDKWMKIIGAGITGYQPEAYALMDLACHELVKLRSDISAIAGHVDCEADSDSILHIIRDLEADNAAKDARVNGFEGLMDSLCEILKSERDIGDVVGALEALNGRNEALEAKLAAAERALETKSAANEALSKSVVESIDTEKRLREALTEIASFTQTTDLLWWQQRARAALGGKMS